MSNEQMVAELARLKAENEALRQKQASGLIVKQSDKSEGIMVLGLRKFPVTFYADEWEKLFSIQDKVRNVAKAIKPVAKATA